MTKDERETHARLIDKLLDKQDAQIRLANEQLAMLRWRRAFLIEAKAALLQGRIEVMRMFLRRAKDGGPNDGGKA